MSSHAPVLLEQLASAGWFARHGEVALTAGLTFCLGQDEEAARGLLEVIGQRVLPVIPSIPTPTRWQAESLHENENRVDIVGWVDTPRDPAPAIFVEAKVGASFGQNQIQGYVLTQQRALAGAQLAHGVLVVLVPEARARAAAGEVTVALDGLGARAGDNWLVAGASRIAVTIISWDAAINAMQARAPALQCDLQQLRGACRALQGGDVRAFNEDDLRKGWRHRKSDLRIIIDRVTAEATAELGLPMRPVQNRAGDGLAAGFRYVAPEGLPNLAVGIRADKQDPPLWVRWHAKTPRFADVERRLTAAGEQPQWHEGHLWLPLRIEPDQGAATRQISRLVKQVVRLHSIATGAAGDPVL